MATASPFCLFFCDLLNLSCVPCLTLVINDKANTTAMKNLEGCTNSRGCWEIRSFIFLEFGKQKLTLSLMESPHFQNRHDLYEFFRKLFGNEVFMRSYMTLKGLFEFKVLPWIFSCHGRGLSSAGQAGSTSALLPKPHYKLDGFRVRRTGGLRRRLQLETGGCYTWWSVCIPVQEPFRRVCHKTVSYDTCSFAELMVGHLKSLG